MTDDAPKLARRVGGLLLLPAGWQDPTVVLWLRRVHAWTGLWGALIFLFLGVSGFLLNHRSQMKIETGEAREVGRLETVLDEPLADPAAFEAYVQSRFGVATDALGGGAKREEAEVAFEGAAARQAEKWTVRFWSPNARVNAEYIPEARLLTATRTDYSFGTFLKELHKGHGVTLAWVLFIDMAAGALLFMSVTGTLLWSRLHGPRLAALGVAGGALALFMLALSTSLITVLP
ncbi:MAG: PepSY-associated TM helix domain-containing protein [Pseudomonadota bacterium]